MLNMGQCMSPHVTTQFGRRHVRDGTVQVSQDGGNGSFRNRVCERLILGAYPLHATVKYHLIHQLV